MNNSNQSSISKSKERKKRLELALKRNILRRKNQATQRQQQQSLQHVNMEKGSCDDNVG